MNSNIIYLNVNLFIIMIKRDYRNKITFISLVEYWSILSKMTPCNPNCFRWRIVSLLLLSLPQQKIINPASITHFTYKWEKKNVNKFGFHEVVSSNPIDKTQKDLISSSYCWFSYYELLSYFVNVIMYIQREIIYN